MNVRGIAGQKDPTVAVACRLSCSVGPCGRNVQGADRHVSVRDAAQDLLHVFEGDWLFCTMKCPAVEVLDQHVTGLRLQVHARCRQVSTRLELFGINEVNSSGVAGKFWFRAREFKTSQLANHAPTAIATHEPLSLEGGVTRLNGHAVFGSMKARDRKPAPDFYAERLCAARQHRFKLGHFGHQTGFGRTRQAIPPLRWVDIAVVKWNAGEVPCLTTRPFHGVRMRILDLPMDLELIE